MPNVPLVILDSGFPKTKIPNGFKIRLKFKMSKLKQKTVQLAERKTVHDYDLNRAEAGYRTKY